MSTIITNSLSAQSSNHVEVDSPIFNSLISTASDQIVGWTFKATNEIANYTIAANVLTTVSEMSVNYTPKYSNSKIVFNVSVFAEHSNDVAISGWYGGAALGRGSSGQVNDYMLEMYEIQSGTTQNNASTGASNVFRWVALNQATTAKTFEFKIRQTHASISGSFILNSVFSSNERFLTGGSLEYGTSSILIMEYK